MATAIPNLANACINLSSLREKTRKELTDILDLSRGRKALILDPQISGPLGLIAESSLLKEHGVEKIYYLSPKLDTDCKNLIYLVRPKVSNMKIIASNIRQHDLEDTASGNYSSKLKKEYSVYFVPRRTMICEKVLEEEGVSGQIEIGEYNLDLIPFDEDVLSLELHSSFRECLLDGDRTSLYYVARAIMKLQANFGIIPNVKGKGTCSRLVYEMMLRMRREMGADEPTITPQIDTIILLDREVDMITPCCTQLTYEGLIDELLQIQNGFLEIEPEAVGAPATPNTPISKKVKIPLNGNDKVYSEIRNMNISQVGGALNKKAKELKAYQDSRHDAASMSQLRDFTKRLGSSQQEGTAARIHFNLLQKIMDFTGSSTFTRKVETEQSLLSGIDFDMCVDYIEECINKKEPIVEVLRLFILLNLTSNGLKAKQLEFFKREILQTYGYHYLFTLNNLEKLNLIKKPDTKPNFHLVRNRLHLLNVEGLDIATPNDIAYVYSGYAPLSVRLVQHAVRPGGWRQIEDSLRALPGVQAFEETQTLPPGLVAPAGSSDSPPVTLVFFIGGVTFTEIAALRYLSTQAHRDFIIATTKLINGDTLVDSILEHVDRKQM